MFRAPEDLLETVKRRGRESYAAHQKKVPALIAIVAVLLLAMIGANLSVEGSGGAGSFSDPFVNAQRPVPNDPQAAPADPAASPSTTAPPPPTGPAGDWALKFSDEFVGDALDDAKWSRCYPHGTRGCTNKGNKELEWYQPENVTVAEGTLRLTAQRQKIRGEDGQNYDYTSGMVTTGSDPVRYFEPAKYQFQYGYVEARMKVPAGKGIWPAFWLLPSDQRWPPEIDIMEVLGDRPDRVHLNNHWTGGNGKPANNQAHWDGPDFSQGWHTFGVDWQPESISWYIDGVERNRFTKPAQIPQEPMFVLLNLAVGGIWGGAPDAATQFPSTFEVDWVRAWQRP